jgi:hypothetical protein
VLTVIITPPNNSMQPMALRAAADAESYVKGEKEINARCGDDDWKYDR